MLDSKHYEQIKWIIARSELTNSHKRGGFHYQKPRSENTIDMHERVSGLHLGLRAVQTDEIINWMDNIKIDLLHINQLDHSFDTTLLPNIGIPYDEYTASPLSSSIHTALEFMNNHKERKPIIFKNDFWYYKEIIQREINNASEIHANNLLIVSVPFFETFKVRDDMADVLEICTKLGVPVMLDLIWLPLVYEDIQLKHSDCVEVITHSMTKVLPLSGIKGGVCLWRRPSPKRHNTYPLGGNLGFHITKQYLYDFGYYHVRNSLVEPRDKWCSILGIEKNNFVYSGTVPMGHFLSDQSLHAHRIPGSLLFNLVPFYENDKIITRYLNDHGLLTSTGT